MFLEVKEMPKKVMGAGQARLLAIWLMATMCFSTAVIICCSNALKAKYEGFAIVYKNVSLEGAKEQKHTWLAALGKSKTVRMTKRNCCATAAHA